MNFNDILNSQINEALDLKQDKKYFDLLIKSAPKLLKVLEFGESYPSVIELKKTIKYYNFTRSCSISSKGGI